MLFNLLSTRRGSDTGRHDEGHVGRSFAKRIQHNAAWLIQNEFKRVGVGCFIARDESGKDAAHGVTTGPTLQ